MNYYLDEDYEVSGLQKIMPKELLNLIDLGKWNIVYYRENINRKTIHNKHPYHNRKHSHKLGYLLLQKTPNIKTKRILNRTYKKGSIFGEPDQQVYDYINFFKTRYNTILDCLVVDANDGKNVFPFARNNFNVTCYEDNEILLNGGIFNHTYTIGLNKRIVDSKLNNITVKNLNYYEVKEIKKWASACDKKVNIYELTSQFRCNGSRDYLSIIDYILGYNDKLNINNINYDIKICDNASELRKIISEKNIKFKSRILAGYCWNWNKKEIDNTNYHDIKIDSFEMSWNLGAKQTYAIDDSINEVGCVHSVQGLEFDYVGVIIGKDMFFKDGRVHTDFHNHASTDPSFKGIKKLEKEDKAYANKIADELIKNAYRVLLTRGTKGCYIYCEDQNLNNFYKNIINNIRKYNNK